MNKHSLFSYFFNSKADNGSIMLTTTKTEAGQKHDLLVEGGEGDEKKI